MIEDRLIDYPEVQALLKCSRRTAQDLVAVGELVPVKLPRNTTRRNNGGPNTGRKRFRLSDVQKLIHDLPEDH